MLCYVINATGTNAQINAFVCPSDPRAGKADHNNTTNTNNYYACVGTTMTWGLIGNQAPYANLQSATVTAINMPSTGMFTMQAAYGIQDCTDGTSNTIAFSEACVGNQGATAAPAADRPPERPDPFYVDALRCVGEPRGDALRHPVVQPGLSGGERE